jgi:hypothetical protein
MKPVYTKNVDTRLAGLERKVRFLERREQIPNGLDLGGLSIFALTADSISADDTPVVVEGTNFFSTSSSTFDESGGRARILTSGTYLIGCQMDVSPTVAWAADQMVALELRYAGGSGFGIEVPWLSGYVQEGGGEQILGTRFVYPVGSDAGYDVGLQRLHPLSLTDAASFPFEIQPTIVASPLPNPGELQVSWFALWGVRVGAPLDSWHSD